MEYNVPLSYTITNPTRLSQISFHPMLISGTAIPGTENHEGECGRHEDEDGQSVLQGSANLGGKFRLPYFINTSDEKYSWTVIILGLINPNY